MTVHPLAPLSGLPCLATDLWSSPEGRIHSADGSLGHLARAEEVDAVPSFVGCDLRAPRFLAAQLDRPAPFVLPFLVDLLVALSCVAAVCWAATVYSPPQRFGTHGSVFSSSPDASRRALPPLEHGEEAFPEDDATARD